MNLRDIIIKENETLLSTEGQQPHNFAAKSQVGQGIEWPKAAGGTTPAKQERDEVELPGDHHVSHGSDSHHGGDGVSESIVVEDGEATSTVSADIAQVVYPMTRGRTRREKRKNARAAVGQKYTPGPAGVGTGVFEGAFDNASPMTKDSINRDRIRSLKNLIAIYTEKGDKNKVRELKKELELLVVERLGEASLATMRDYFAGQGDGYRSK